MNTQTFAQAQNIAPITDDALIAVNGGGILKVLVNKKVSTFAPPHIGIANDVGAGYGYSGGDAVESYFS